MTKPQVDAIARGHVWSGEDAKARGLVDQMGGLLDAVDAARRRAGIAVGEEVELALMGEPKGLLASAAGEEGVLTALLPEATQGPALPESLARLALELGLDPAGLSATGLQARIEFGLTVR